MRHGRFGEHDSTCPAALAKRKDRPVLPGAARQTCDASTSSSRLLPTSAGRSIAETRRISADKIFSRGTKFSGLWAAIFREAGRVTVRSPRTRVLSSVVLTSPRAQKKWAQIITCAPPRVFRLLLAERNAGAGFGTHVPSSLEPCRAPHRFRNAAMTWLPRRRPPLAAGSRRFILFKACIRGIPPPVRVRACPTNGLSGRLKAGATKKSSVFSLHPTRCT